MGKIDRAKEQVALKVVGEVLSSFKACGIISKTVHDTQMGMAIADATQSIERYVKIEEYQDAAARAEERERIIDLVQKESKAFGSNEYAVGQPLSSFSERFACSTIIDAIRNLGDSHE